MQCSNNLKQLGLAVHTLADATKLLPSAMNQKSFTVDMKAKNGWTDYAYRDRLSCFCVMLPYIEQTALYEQIKENADQGLNPAQAHVNDKFCKPWATTCETLGAAPWTAQISAFLCPSSGSKSTAGALAYTSYHGCVGDFRQYWNDYEARGAIGINGAQKATFGLEGLTDGTSNVILFSETVIAPATTGSNKIKGGIAVVAGLSSRTMTPDNCLNTRGSNGSFATGVAYANSNAGVGGRWGDGHYIYTQFTAILPPNSPNCANSTSGEDWAFVTASSEHTGGVNVAVGDGSVRFVSDTINAGANADKTECDFGAPSGNPQHWAGASIRGIWGELATRAGGESAAFP